MKPILLIKGLVRPSKTLLAAKVGMLLFSLLSLGAHACGGYLHEWKVGRNESPLILCIQPGNPPGLLVAWNHLIRRFSPGDLGGLVVDSFDSQAGVFGPSQFVFPTLEFSGKKALLYRDRAFNTEYNGSLKSAVFTLPSGAAADIPALLKQFRSGQRTQPVALNLVTASFGKEKRHVKMVVSQTGVEISNAVSNGALPKFHRFDLDLRFIQAGMEHEKDANRHTGTVWDKDTNREINLENSYSAGALTRARFSSGWNYEVLFELNKSGRATKITSVRQFREGSGIIQGEKEFFYDNVGRLVRVSQRYPKKSANAEAPDWSPPEVIDLTYAARGNQASWGLETLAVDGELALRIGYDRKGWPMWFMRPGKCVVFLDYFPEANESYRTELSSVSLDGKSNCLNEKMAAEDRVVLRP